MTSFPTGKFVTLLFAGVVTFWMLLFTDVPLLRLAVSAPLLLLLPGYATVAAIFPKWSLNAAERLLFSTGISIGFTVVGGLLLHCLPFGLQRGVWTVVLVTFILIISAHTLLLTKSSLEKTVLPVHQSSQIWRVPITLPFRPRQIFLVGLAIVVVVAAFNLAHTPAPQQGLEGYTMLWISPGKVGTGAALLGVRNMEFTTVQYRLHFEADDHVLAVGPVLMLKPGETWEKQVLLPAEYLYLGPVTVLLYRLDAATEPYRRVIWWPK